jgi:hypothetical protein
MRSLSALWLLTDCTLSRWSNTPTASCPKFKNYKISRHPRIIYRLVDDDGASQDASGAEQREHGVVVVDFVQCLVV